ncbi:SsrA-binding protein [Hathewaya proteolytica DSM 3090]|uniref:SsrA-binding protein n=1 Tax=Hathewaya proteolytica DSM 3090 TaxID=1121331 RepID=A0A1M6NVR7_9CLOT|nr:SsrA-binding protein SmpB [Hathewaya proteolytica]SHJ99847.1 SsrA-binding protein [Hathewaya proteolytica DSM 3090]
MKKEKVKGNLAENRKAFHDYFIEETFEAGLSLVGTEVKSIRAGKANLKDSYAFVKNREVFICNMHISPYEQGNIFNRDPLRDRKCLLHKNEILKLESYASAEGYTLIPLSLYLVRGKVKVKIGVAKGKHNYDKREALKEKQAVREVAKHFKEMNKY